MIHTLPITSDTEPEAYTKLFRKKLMTGGAVVALADGLSDQECRAIGEKFIPKAVPHSIAAEVCRALALYPSTPPDTLDALRQLELPLVTLDLQRRADGA